MVSTCVGVERIKLRLLHFDCSVAKAARPIVGLPCTHKSAKSIRRLLFGENYRRKEVHIEGYKVHAHMVVEEEQKGKSISPTA